MADAPLKDREYPAFGYPDPQCPNADGYIIAKAYERSTFDDWWDDTEDCFLGMIERLPGQPDVYHRLCPVCRGHFFAIGSCPAVDDLPSRAAPAN